MTRNKFTFLVIYNNVTVRCFSDMFIRELKPTRKPYLPVMKSILFAAAAASFLAAPAFAGPYVNIESNTGFTGSDYEGTVTETHIGYEGDISDSASYYVQAGPALVNADGEDLETEVSGKAGVDVALTENLDIYGEVSFITGEDEAGYGTKLGVKYSF